MSSRSLEARSVGNAVKWSELLLNTFGPTTLRNYIDARDMAMSSLFATTIASINAQLAQKANLAGAVFTGPVLFNAPSSAPNAPVTNSVLDARVNALLNGAPAALDTLGEVAAFITSNSGAIGTLTTNKLNRTGDTAHGLSSDGWFTSIANTGWRTSYGSGFTQSNAARLEVTGSAILSAGNGVESSQYVALVTAMRSVFRFQQGSAVTDFYRDPNGDVGLVDSVLGSIWRMVASTGDLEFNRRVKLNLSTIPGSGSYLGVDANGYLVRLSTPAPVGTPVGTPPVGSPVGSPVGTPPVGTPPVGTPPVGTPVGSPVG